MTLVSQLHEPLGRLILSPAVTPSEAPISSSDGAQTVPSESLEKGNKVQRSQSLVGYADANGEADIVFDGPAPGFKWTVERAAVGSMAAKFTKCDVHAGDINEDNPFLTLVETTPVPATDIADENSPIYLGQDQTLTFRFTGGDPEDDATVRIQYTEEKL